MQEEMRSLLDKELFLAEGPMGVRLRVIMFFYGEKSVEVVGGMSPGAQLGPKC
jgi:hypothetical protein